MTREQFEHAVRAAGALPAVDAVIVIGSQALHGSVDHLLPQEAARSVELEVAVPGDRDGRKADLIEVGHRRWPGGT